MHYLISGVFERVDFALECLQNLVLHMSKVQVIPSLILIRRYRGRHAAAKIVRSVEPMHRMPVWTKKQCLGYKVARLDDFSASIEF